MTIQKQILIPFMLATLVLFSFSAASVEAAQIGPQLQSVMQEVAAGEKVKVIISLSDQVDLKALKKQHKFKNKKQKRKLLLKALKDKTDLSQRELRKMLKKAKIKKIKPLWMINALAVTLPVEMIDQLALLPGIDSIRLDSTLALPQAQVTGSAPAEWNLDAINAGNLWALGFTGQGTVIASIGTGVDVEHQDLAGKYRGGANSWYDPNGEHTTPYDASGHGTQTMGLMVGGEAGGTAIGVAPGSQWIAAKVYNDVGTASYSAIHQGFQWLLDPDGELNTDDAPDVVNGSWGFDQFLDQCFTEFQADVQALKAAEIAVVFSAGNAGPSYNTSMSPANYPETTSVGGVDMNLGIANFSSAGPSACGSETYPKLVAPGVFVKTSDLTFGGLFPDSYTYTSGTSFAAPHVAASYALLKSAFPNTTLAELETTLQQTALDLTATGPDNDSGYGLVDVSAAYDQLNGGSATDTVTILRTRYNAKLDQLRVWANSTAAPGATLTLVGHGDMPYVGNVNFDYRFYAPNVLSNPGTASVTSDQGGSDAQAVAYTAAPVAMADAYAVDEGAILTVAAGGVLDNDSKGGYFAGNNGLTAMIVSDPANGTLTLNEDGSFDYQHDGSETLNDSFTYVANAINTNSLAVLNTSAPTTVVLTINPVNDNPVANADTATTDDATAINIDLLANDTDIDSSNLSVASVDTTGTNGSVTNNGIDVTYMPNAGFSGDDIFTYIATDGIGNSNSATVTVSVTASINQAPVAVNDTLNIALGSGSTLIDLIGNDYDPDGTIDAATTCVRLGNYPNNCSNARPKKTRRGGTIVNNYDGSVLYNPPVGFVGTDRFNYRVKDNAGADSNKARVRINITQ